MRTRSFLVRAVASALALATFCYAAHPVSAQINYTGTTSGAPTWNRPIENGSDPPDTLSGVGTAVPYSAFAFTPATTGLYDFLSLGTNPSGWDNYSFLYQGSFNAASPLSNVAIGNDDFNTIGRSGFNGVSLTAGNQYFFVTTGFSNDDFGDFSNSITLQAPPPPSFTYTYTGDTQGGTRWNRPIANGGSPPDTLSGVGTDVLFSAFQFEVPVSGAYDFLSLGIDPSNWDNYLFLYDGFFDPTDPLAGVLLGSDDFNTVGRAGFDGVNLLGGHIYNLVTTGFANDDAGVFRNTITGPGLAFGVPEPGAAALLLGLGALGLSLRRRRS